MLCFGIATFEVNRVFNKYKHRRAHKIVFRLMPLKMSFVEAN